MQRFPRNMDLSLQELVFYERKFEPLNPKINYTYGFREDVDFFHLHPYLTWTYLIVLSVFMAVGCVGNVFVLGAIMTDKRLQTLDCLFVANLAIADMGVTMFVDPFSILGVILGPRFFVEKPHLCHLIASICLTTCVCSLWSIAAIAVNRYIKICHMDKYSRVYTKRNAVMMIVCLWTFSLLLDLPNFLGWGGHTYDFKTLACSYDRLASYSYTIFFISGFIAIPVFTVLFCNACIYLKYTKSQRKMRSKKFKAVPKITVGEGQSLTKEDKSDDGKGQLQIKEDHQKSNQLMIPQLERSHSSKKQLGSGKKLKVRVSDYKLAVTLFIIFFVFLVCWTPYGILCLWDYKDNVPKIVYLIAIKIAHGNSSFNSVMYLLTNRLIREGYLTFWRRITCEKFPSTHRKCAIQDTTWNLGSTVGRSRSPINKDSV